jgi:hypothetical protein
MLTQRNHKIEQYTSTIVSKLCKEINEIMGKPSAGFAAWQSNNLKKIRNTDLDPNYLHESELQNSPFHQAFHKFIL